MATSAPGKGKKGVKRTRGLGWIPDLPDHRDIIYTAVRPVRPALPPKVDLRAGCGPVEDNGQLSSSTGNALADALEFLERKDKKPVVSLSRLFIYYNQRVLEHSIEADAGAMIRSGIKTLAKHGACSERKWPYAVSRLSVKPGPACYQDALEHHVGSYQRILTLNDMKLCLAEGFPFVFGFTVYEGFESDEVANTGVLDMPRRGERPTGGHAALAVGYDDVERRFVVRNSWGKGWGMNGYYTMPYEYLMNRDLSDDLWTIRRGDGV